MVCFRVAAAITVMLSACCAAFTEALRPRCGPVGAVRCAEGVLSADLADTPAPLGSGSTRLPARIRWCAAAASLGRHISSTRRGPTPPLPAVVTRPRRYNKERPFPASRGAAPAVARRRQSVAHRSTVTCDPAAGVAAPCGRWTPLVAVTGVRCLTG